MPRLDDVIGAQTARELGLVGIARRDRHTGGGEIGSQHGDGEEPENAGAVHERPGAVDRRRLENGMQADRKGIGENGLVKADPLRDGEELRFVRRHERRIAAGDGAIVAGVHARGQRALSEVGAEGVLPPLAGIAGRIDVARRAG